MIREEFNANPCLWLQRQGANRKADATDYRVMLECTRRASEFTPLGRMRHDERAAMARSRKG